MKKDYLDKFYNKSKDNWFTYGKEKFPKHFLNSYNAGNREFYQKNLSETKKFDAKWIKTVESYFPSIDKITRDPKSFLKFEEDVVAVERSKKISPRSVQHLAQNSQYVREVTDEGFVIPSKVLNVRAEQDYAIYENRFIATLIERLFLFVRNRYEVIKENVESSQKDHVTSKNDFNFEGQKVEMNIDLLITRDLDDDQINIYNRKLLERVEVLNTLVSSLKQSKFMKLLKGYKKVRPPIMKTNIILKSPEFRNAYNLWIFMDKYTTLGYDVDVKEKNINFDEDFESKIDNLFLMVYSTIVGEQRKRHTLYDFKNGYIEYEKKASRIAKTNPKDMVSNPDKILMEDNSLNEYFLLKYRSLFNQSVELYQEDGEVKTPSAIRKALKKTLEIGNGLYDNIFEFKDTTNIFDRLVKGTDWEREYEINKYQLRYARVIREIKGTDYKEAIKREKSIRTRLVKTNKELIKIREEELQGKYNTDELIAKYNDDIAKMQVETEELKKQIKILNDETYMSREEKALLNKNENDAKQEVARKIRELKAGFKARVDKVKADGKERIALERQKQAQLKKDLREANKKHRKLINDQIKADFDKVNQEFLQEKSILDSQIAEEKAKLGRDYDIVVSYRKNIRAEAAALRLQRRKEARAIMLVKQYEQAQKLKQIKTNL